MSLIRYGLSLVLVAKHPPAWIGEASRQKDAVVLITAQSKTLHNTSECEYVVVCVCVCKMTPLELSGAVTLAICGR